MHSIQSSFFEKIRQHAPGHKNLAAELASLLNISKNAAYKRLSGFTSLTLEEALLLAHHYGISLDDLISERKGMAAPVEAAEGNDAWRLLEMFEKELDKHEGEKQIKLWAISVDLPLFLYFFSKKLTAFKYYTWQQERGETGPFSTRSDEVRLFCNRADRVLAKLLQLPINIIMTDRVLDGLFRQINEYFEMGNHLTADDVNGLFGEVRKLVLSLKQMASNGALPEQTGVPESGLKIRFFINNVLETSNFLLFNNGHRFSVFDLDRIPGFTTIDRPTRGLFVKDWVDYLARHAMPISMSNEKERRVFFKKLENKIDLEEVKMLAVVS